MNRPLFLLAVLALGVSGCQSTSHLDTPEQLLTKEIRGKDGAPMALIPIGQFLYGNSNERISLPAFYMDKYEVTVGQYARYLQTTGRKEPEYWDLRKQIDAESRPVIGIDWYDAYAYCRHYDKRLPTEQEWEKAARGIDGRLYPWGNAEPTSQHANYGKADDMRLNFYQTHLTAVGSYEKGKSPFGIYDLTGNVWEWTGSDDLYGLKEVRGGSWHSKPGASDLRSATQNVVEPSFHSAVSGFRCVQ